MTRQVRPSPSCCAIKFIVILPRTHVKNGLPVLKRARCLWLPVSQTSVEESSAARMCAMDLIKINRCTSFIFSNCITLWLKQRHAALEPSTLPSTSKSSRCWDTHANAETPGGNNHQYRWNKVLHTDGSAEAVSNEFMAKEELANARQVKDQSSRWKIWQRVESPTKKMITPSKIWFHTFSFHPSFEKSIGAPIDFSKNDRSILP